MTATVRKARGAGKGWEVWDGTQFVGHFHTNRQAWRAADDRNGEVKSRSEDVADWISRKEPQ